MSPLISIDPATGERMWEGEVSDAAAVAGALGAARAAFARWSVTPLDTRIAHVRAYAAMLAADAEPLARIIAQESGSSPIGRRWSWRWNSAATIRRSYGMAIPKQPHRSWPLPPSSPPASAARARAG